MSSVSRLTFYLKKLLVENKDAIERLRRLQENPGLDAIITDSEARLSSFWTIHSETLRDHFEVLDDAGLRELATWAGEEVEYRKRMLQQRMEARLETRLISQAVKAEGKPLPKVVDLLRHSTPLSDLYHYIVRQNVRWGEDDRDPIKAYVMACFSELAYLHLTEAERQYRNRYTLFEPSLVLVELRGSRLRIDLQAILASVGEIELRVFEIGSFIYLVLSTTKFVAIAVRGTARRREWLMNLDAAKNVAREGLHHRGFSDEACMALPSLYDAVEDRARRPLYFTGHSQGAGVASILSLIWPDRSALRTPYFFASPRFGTRSATEGFHRFSYSRPWDVVPHLPPRFMGYSDAGSEQISLQTGGHQHSGLSKLAIWQRSFEDHRIEGIRKQTGAAVGSNYSERVYIDALVDDMMETCPHR